MPAPVHKMRKSMDNAITDHWEMPIDYKLKWKMQDLNNPLVNIGVYKRSKKVIQKNSKKERSQNFPNSASAVVNHQISSAHTSMPFSVVEKDSNDRHKHMEHRQTHIGCLREDKVLLN